MNPIGKSISSDGDSKVNDFIFKLGLEKFESDQDIAEETLKVVEVFVFDEEIKSARALIDSLSCVGNILQTHIPYDTTPNNIVQRVIKIIKEEYIALKKANSESNGHLDLLNPKVCTFDDTNVDFEMLRENVTEALAEQKAELEQCQEIIALQGESKIHSDEIIMTCGYCPIVFGFLVKAAKKRRFHAIVAECAPIYSGHKMAKLLASASIQTTLIQDSAIFSLMSIVNKVIIGCKTVLCNGGIKAFLGAASLACIAKFHTVPVYVCTPTFKFSPDTTEDVKDFDSSPLVIPSNQIELFKNVNATVAKIDYVPPEQITSFITNNRGIAPSYVYRQVGELYHPSSDDV